MSSIHPNPSPLAGKTVKAVVQGKEWDYRVEDWWDRVSGQSWMAADGNLAALNYATRVGYTVSIPRDNEVLYGHIGGIGHLIHAGEILGDVNAVAGQAVSL